MSVTFKGVCLVPMEGSMIRAYNNLGIQDRLANFDACQHMRYDDNGSLKQAYYVLLPSEVGVTKEHRAFVLDTPTGRKIVLRWAGKTYPIMDWEASNEDVLEFIESLKEISFGLKHRESRRRKPWVRKYYHKKWDWQAIDIDGWIELLLFAVKFRDELVSSGRLLPLGTGNYWKDQGVDRKGDRRYRKLYEEANRKKASGNLSPEQESWYYREMNKSAFLWNGKELASSEEVLVRREESAGFTDKFEESTGYRPFYGDRVNDRVGIDAKEPKFNFFRISREIRVVGDAYYYRDVKICKTGTSLQWLREYIEGGEEQARLALLKYKVLGEPADLRYYNEKIMKAKINRALLIKLTNEKKNPEKEVVDLGLEEKAYKFLERFAKHEQLSPEEAFDPWRTACLKAYIDNHKRTGKWQAPKRLKPLLGQKMNFFEVILLRYGNKTFGYQDSEVFRDLDIEYRPQKFDTLRNKSLEQFLPVEEAKTRQAGAYYFRRSKSAQLHYRLRSA